MCIPIYENYTGIVFIVYMQIYMYYSALHSELYVLHHVIVYV